MVEEHVHVSCVACHELTTVPLHIISKSASHHVELQVTLVLNSLLSLGHTSGNEGGLNVGIHDTLAYWCVTSSQSILLPFRYIHAKFVLLSWLVPDKTIPVKIIYPVSHGLRVIHVKISKYTHWTECPLWTTPLHHVIYSWTCDPLMKIALPEYSTVFGKKSLIDVIVAAASHEFQNVIWYTITSQAWTCLPVVQSKNVFLIRRRGAGKSSSSHVIIFPWS